MKKQRRIAVLGAGIMGSCAALLLVRQGWRVTLIDAAPAPLMRASRWNEGKIHLGYLYAADPGLQTARHMLPGSLAFVPLLEDCLNTSIEPYGTSAGDIYLCHRDSVVSADEQWSYIKKVDALVRSHASEGRYLDKLDDARSARLSPSELRLISDSPDILAAFRTPEHSVSTTAVADLLTRALETEPAINLLMATRVAELRSTGGSWDGPWRITTDAGSVGDFDCVINALWEGKLAVDRTLGIAPPARFSHRFRRALFVKTRVSLDIPSAVVSTGPFGDVKNFGGRDFYVSWYPAGLAAYGTDPDPPAVVELNAQQEADFIEESFERLGRLLPAVHAVREQAEVTRVEGGWVYAAGKGRLENPRSSLHHRADFGIEQHGSYFSIDTGKFCAAPWLARRLASRLA